MVNTAARCSVVAALLGGAWGCSSGPDNPFVIPYIPPPVDEALDMDVVPGLDIGSVDPGCVVDGTVCQLSNATGVCSAGRCRFLACVFGSADCDEDLENGCEQDVSSSPNCGQCGRTCRDSESCQLGDSGYVCSAGVVCGDDTFDLDRELSNGCEWRIADEENTALQPFGRVALPELYAVAADGRGVVLGFDAEGARVSLSASAGDDEQPTRLNLPDGVEGEPFSPRPLGLVLSSLDAVDAVSVWPDYLFVHRGDGESVVVQTPCANEDETSRQWRSFDERGGRVIASARRYVLSGQMCDEQGVCFDVDGGFGPADYLREFYPYQDSPSAFSFSTDEVASCQTCALDVAGGADAAPRACFGEKQCRAAGVDLSAECSECEGVAIGCPELDVRDVIVAESGRAFVVTARGLIVLDEVDGVWRGVARIESEFEPGVVTTSGFIGGAVFEMADVTRVFLVHSSSFVRVFDVDLVTRQIRPVVADVGIDRLEVDSRGVMRIAALDERTLMIMDQYTVRVLSVGDASARRFLLEQEQDVSGDGYYWGEVVESGFDVFAVEFGNLRQISLERGGE